MREQNQQRMSYEQAKKRVKRIRGFYIHLVIYIVVNTAILIFDSNRKIFVDGNLQFWGIANLFFWGIGLFAHWASVFGPNVFLTKRWEERKIKELMEKDSYEQKKWK
ncbi:2TM domain-containing protein [Gillisia sp. M10.2A]|uniref:2TM domain-containing protein n=1 Tax=Gillisia lutea TaxID=2909668 RepID=A0ABS9EG13_9FLAO|nr:2TM domain-containing protein [Gillisia lutea]MCF4101825.1 2TM domain-containing protein [Gillisia lutea]